MRVRRNESKESVEGLDWNRTGISGTGNICVCNGYTRTPITFSVKLTVTTWHIATHKTQSNIFSGCFIWQYLHETIYDNSELDIWIKAMCTPHVTNATNCSCTRFFSSVIRKGNHIDVVLTTYKTIQFQCLDHSIISKNLYRWTWFGVRYFE